MLERYPNQTKEFHFNMNVSVYASASASVCTFYPYVSIEDGVAVDMIAFVLGRI